MNAHENQNKNAEESSGQLHRLVEKRGVVGHKGGMENNSPAQNVLKLESISFRYLFIVGAVK